jgi:hypothetical protein
MYSEAAFRDLRDVHGSHVPASGSSRVGRPIKPKYDIVGPDDVAPKVPPALPAGVYVVDIDDGTADARAQNLLDVRNPPATVATPGG